MNTYKVEPMKHGGNRSDDYVTGWNDCYAAIEADRKHTDDLISAYQEKIRALEAENHALISESDNRQANNLESLTPAEAVFAFASWLTGRSDPVTLSSRHGAAIAVDLAVAFNESQGLHRFREDFHKHIKPYPAEKDQQARNCGQCVPLSTDGTAVFIDGVGEVPLDFSGQARGEPVYLARFDKGFWQECSKGRFDFLKDPTHPSAGKWEFRVLYTAPQPQQQASEPKGTVYWLNASPTVAWVGRPPDDGEHIYTTPQPQQIPEGYKPTKLNIGVSATAKGAAICIMKPNADGTVTVIYSGTHPLGDSLGYAMLEAATQPTTENP